MLIGELVQKSGLTRDTIRFYEKKGLIALTRTARRKNNYKVYPDTVLHKLLLIKRLKDMGFTLNEIDTFLALWKEDDASCLTLKSTLENKVLSLNEQLIRLTQLKLRLTDSLQNCYTDNCEFEKSVTSCL